MRTLICLLLFIVASVAQRNNLQYDLNDSPALFEKYIKDYNRQYKDEADKEARYQAFRKTLKVINRLNSQQSYVTFKITALADYTPKESIYGQYQLQSAKIKAGIQS